MTVENGQLRTVLPVAPPPGSDAAQGIDNVNREQSVPPYRVRQAENVDFDRDGRVKRRAGYSRVIAGSAHSLWSAPDFPYMLAVIDSALVAIDSDYNTTPLVTGVGHVVPVSYEVVDRTVYWSNRQRSGRITAALEALPLGIEAPGTPNVSAHSVGGLHEGSYIVATTYIASNGEESGACQPAVVDVAEGQGIMVGSMSQSADPTVTSVGVYVTDCNGETLFLKRSVVNGSSQVVIGAAGHTTRTLDTLWLKPLPPGHIVAYYNGRLWVASGRMLYWSDALRYGYYDPTRNYIRFDDDVSLLAPSSEGSSGGLFIAAGKRTYYMEGDDPKKMRRTIVYPHGAVVGSQVFARGTIFGGEQASRMPVWVASNGVFCAGSASGSVTPLTEASYTAPSSSRGASILREYMGQRHIMVNLKGRGVDGFRARDSVVATVVRNGVVVDQ
jgi:hypothetical protein